MLSSAAALQCAARDVLQKSIVEAASSLLPSYASRSYADLSSGVAVFCT
jgi:hypothetical protein